MRTKPASILTIALVACAVLVWSAAPVLAQAATGTISGTVTDETGAIMPGVSVTLKNVDTGANRNAVTDRSGDYFEPSLTLGAYEVRAELSGFQTGVRQGITLTVGRHAVVDFKMKVGDIQEQVTITAEAPLVDTKSASVGGLVEQQQLEELPLEGRSYGQLTRLVAGAVRGVGRATGSSGGARSGFQAGYTEDISIRGSRVEGNKILLDGTDIQGIDNKLPGSVGGVTLGVDAVREFRVEVGTYGAEYGRALGGVINVSTKSGTNQFRGSAFEFHRNAGLDAKNFFDEGRAPFRRNQFGGSLGGPIARDKAFFFANWEALHERLGFTNIANVPNALARQGFIPNASGQLVNIGVAPQVAPYLALYPMPNGRDFGDGRAEYVQSGTQPTDQNFLTLRLDNQFTDRDTFFVRYTYDGAKRMVPHSNFTFMREPSLSRNQFLTVEHRKILSSTLFNTVRFGLARNYKAIDLTISDRPAPPELAFIPGLNFEEGELVVTGLGQIGGNRNSPRQWGANKYQFADQMMWRAGRHAVKLGLEVFRFHQDLVQAVDRGGQYTFSSLTNLLRATPRQFRGTLPGSDQTRHLRTMYLGWYVQDDLEVNKRLTLNLGLRHEVHTGPTETSGLCSNVDDMYQSEARVGCPLFPTFARNFGPRLGFAWDVFGEGKTAVRGGAGLYYSEMSASSYYTSATTQAPFSRVADVRNPTFPDVYAQIVKSGQVRLRGNSNDYTAVPHNIQVSLSVQQQLGTKTMASLGYAGTLGRHMIIRGEQNTAAWQILPDGRKYFPADSQKLSPYWQEVMRVPTVADSAYSGLLAEFRRRIGAGASVQASYTWAKAMDYVPFTISGQVMDLYDLARDRGPSDSDVRHNLSVATTWQVPAVGQGVIGSVISGWQVAGIVTLASGHPFTAHVDYNISRNQAGFVEERPNLVAGRSNNPVLGGPDQYYDPTAFELQAPGFYGNLGRNTLIGPGFTTVDFSLSKSVGLGAQRRLQIRAEVFNALNRANFGVPDDVVFAASGRNGSAGRITDTAGAARQVQLGVKVYF